MNIFCLIGAVICFTIGTFTKLAPADVNWQNAGLALVTLALVLG